jgi:hypothetical protein
LNGAQNLDSARQSTCAVSRGKEIRNGRTYGERETGRALALVELNIDKNYCRKLKGGVVFSALAAKRKRCPPSWWKISQSSHQLHRRPVVHRGSLSDKAIHAGRADAEVR